MKLYCPTCGGATNYSLEKPKFCGSCGEPLTALGKFPAKRVFRSNPTNPTQMVQEVEEEEFSLPNIDQLDFILEGKGKISDRIKKLENIIGTSIGYEDDGYVRETGPTYLPDSIEADFMRDAGSSRRTHDQT